MIRFYLKDKNRNITTIGVIYPESRIILKKSKEYSTLDELLGLLVKMPSGLSLHMKEDDKNLKTVNFKTFYTKYIESLSGYTFPELVKKHPNLNLSIDNSNTIWSENIS